MFYVDEKCACDVHTDTELKAKKNEMVLQKNVEFARMRVLGVIDLKT